MPINNPKPPSSYRIRKVYRKNCYRVFNKRTRKIYAKCTSKPTAKKQVRLLTAIRYNARFTPYNRSFSRNKNTQRRRIQQPTNNK